jgi:hypothetical protein
MARPVHAIMPPINRGYLMRLLALALLTLSLSACSTWNEWMGNDKSSAKDDEPMACLPVFVPAELATGSFGNGDSPMDVTANVRLATGEVECEEKDGKLHQTVKVNLTASKGPALKNGETNVAFFAALVATTGEVAAKKQYQTNFKFADELKVEEEQTLVFNINKSDATKTNIYIGLSNTIASIQ